MVRTKDRPQLLCRALLNIDEQTFPDYSVVVVNDAGEAVMRTDFAGTKAPRG